MRLSALALLAAVAAVPAADWPHQRGPLLTGSVGEGQPLPTMLPETPKTLWKGKVGEGFAAPVVAGGRVFYLDLQNGQEVVHAMNAATAKPLWEANLDTPHKDGFGTGPRCAPVSDGKLVFAQSCKGQLSCFAADNGKPVWAVNYVKDFAAVYTGEKGDAKGGSRHGYTASPILDGEHLYALVSGKGAGVVCFEKATGKVVWKSQDDQAAYAPPVVATIAGTRQVVCFTVQGALGLAAKDGALLWRVPLSTNYGRHVMAPIVHGDLVLVASHEVGMVATRIVAKDGGFSAEKAWSRKELGCNFSSPVAVGGYLYGLFPGKKVACAEIATGKTMWEQEGVVTSSADKGFAAFIAMDKHVLALNDTGELILFAADPAAFTQVGRVQVCGNNWCHPAYADGVLYLRDHKQLLAVELVAAAPKKR